MQITIQDLKKMNAQQIAAFAAYNETDTQTDSNTVEDWDWENDFNYVGSRHHY